MVNREFLSDFYLLFPLCTNFCTILLRITHNMAKLMKNGQHCQPPFKLNKLSKNPIRGVETPDPLLPISSSMISTTLFLMTHFGKTMYLKNRQKKSLLTSFVKRLYAAVENQLIPVCAAPIPCRGKQGDPTYLSRPASRSESVHEHSGHAPKAQSRHFCYG